MTLNIILVIRVAPVVYTMWTYSKSAADEDLANLQSLWNQLRKTEKNLQTVEEELSSTHTSERCGPCLDEAVNFTLEDLVQPNCNYQGFSDCKKNAGKTSFQDFQRKSEYPQLLIKLQKKMNVLRRSWMPFMSKMHL